MKKLFILTVMTAFVMSLSVAALAAGNYYEFSSYAGAGSEYDVACYGNTIYYGGGNQVKTIDVFVSDISKKDEPYYLADGFTLNPNYQTRTFSNPKAFTLKNASGNPMGGLNGASWGEMYVDASYIYTTGGNYTNQVYKFDKTSGNYAGQAVTNTATNVPLAALLSYGNGKWWMADDWHGPASTQRTVYSSNGGNWVKEFTWPNMLGSHGDGMEFVNGYVFVTDMTSNFIGQWEKTAAGWSEKERYSYTELFGGSSKDVEGLGYGALGHFWAGNGSRVYELGGGNIQDDIDPQVPEPATMVLLGSLLTGIAGFSKRKNFSKN